MRSPPPSPSRSGERSPDGAVLGSFDISDPVEPADLLATVKAQLLDSAAGITVGRYTLKERIGGGGAGVVYRAFDPELERDVAIKLLRSDHGASGLIAEARAVARLRHPNVVRVFDVGTYDRGTLTRALEPGTPAALAPFLVMELVEGTTLAGWLQGTRRPLEIVGVFLDAGRGLAAAHRAGLVHRDFKPSNVLVGSDGQVMVADFGLVGHSGAPMMRIVGTPAYMAPEQRRGEASVASDQYSFCVALYEALYGRRPEDQTRWPRDPSVPARVVAVLRKGLQEDPSRRWPSMERLLGGLRPPRRSLVRAAAVSATAGVTVAAAIAWLWPHHVEDDCAQTRLQLGGAWDDARREAVQRSVLAAGNYGPDLWTYVHANLDEYASAWTAMQTQACRTRSRTDKPDALLQARFACLAAARDGLGAVTTVLAELEPQEVRNADGVVRTLPALDHCAEAVLAAADDAQPPAELEEAVAEARARLVRTEALWVSGERKGARRLLDEVSVDAEALAFAPLLVDVSLAKGRFALAFRQVEAAGESLGLALRSALRAGRWDEAVEAAGSLAYNAAVAHARSGTPSVSSEVEVYADLGRALLSKTRAPLRAEADFRETFGLSLNLQREHERAEVQLRWACSLHEAVRGPDDLRPARCRINLALALVRNGRMKEAEPELLLASSVQEKRLGEAHPEVARARFHLARVALAGGRFGEAAELARAALEVRRRVYGPAHPRVHDTITTLSYALAHLGDEDAATRLLEEVLASTSERAPEEPGPEIAWARLNLSGMLRSRGKLVEAEKEIRRALATLEALYEPGHPNTMHAKLRLGQTIAAAGRYAEAEPILRAVATAVRERHGADNSLTLKARAAVARVAGRQGRYDEAATELQRILEAADTSSSVRDRVHFHGCMAEVRSRSQHHAAALEHARHALDEAVRSMPLESTSVAEAQAGLGDALAAAGRTDEAEAVYEQARAFLDRALGRDHPLSCAVRRGLGDVAFARGQFDAANTAYSAALTGASPIEAANARLGLGRALVELRRADAAREPLELAWRFFDRPDVPLDRRARAALALSRATRGRRAGRLSAIATAPDSGGRPSPPSAAGP